jgi:hypothetical protein
MARGRRWDPYNVTLFLRVGEPRFSTHGSTAARCGEMRRKGDAKRVLSLIKHRNFFDEEMT